MANFLAPILNDQQVDANGDPLSGGTVEVYFAGTSTAATTYSDQGGLAPNTWPIVLNTLGVNSQGAVWITGGIAYKYVIKDAAGVVQRTIDNISGINDAAVNIDQWVVFQAPPSYVSSVSFSLVGDQTPTFQVGRRIKTQNTGGTIYSTITNAVYSTGITTITVVNDSGVLDSGLSQVAYGLISAQSSSLQGPWIQVLGSPTASTGTFTSAQYVLKYSVVAKTAYLNVVVTILTNGTASGRIIVPLPFSVAAESTIAGRESQATGNACTGTINTNQLNIFKYDNSYPGGTGYRIALNGVVEVA